MTDLLHRILSGTVPAFALVQRPESSSHGCLEVLTGPVMQFATLAELPIAQRGQPGPAVLAMLPYRQLTERGFACVDDGTPLLAMAIAEHETPPLVEALTRIPTVPIKPTATGFDIGDAEYADLVRQVITEEIGRGKGANFVLKRTFRATLPDYSVAQALTFFRRLVERESGAYWTFLVHTGDRTLVGASPERHLALRNEILSMNPISGTYRYPPSGPSLPEVIRFLSDSKETDELYMVLDEELKMMARVCDDGGRVSGPLLKEMANLAHTEYLIEGRTTRPATELLRETLFAPTVTGSPVESACRIISRYEPGGRGYYSGVVALIGADERGQQTLDSAILIRTADIDAGGQLGISVGATIVRHSSPDAEAEETRSKAAGLLSALTAGRSPRFANHPEVSRALARRNDAVSAFWLDQEHRVAGHRPGLVGRRVLVIDAEDTFTAMLAVQLGALGLAVEVRRFDEPHHTRGYDLIVMGPGPGDPAADDDDKINRLGSTMRDLLERGQPMLAVCLSHQILARLLGLRLEPLPRPNQGAQQQIDLFGRTAVVGFYNTFSAVADTAVFEHGGLVEVARDPVTGAVHALRGPTFRSVQFHPESVLTRDGPVILAELIEGLLGPAREAAEQLTA
jgi:2-amino-4-deoxychorismate synthase